MSSVFQPGAGAGGEGGGSSGTVVGGVLRITADGTYNLADDVTLVSIANPSGDVEVVMPAAADHGGRHVWIKRALSAHQTLVTAAGSPEVATCQLDADGTALHLASDGQVWLVL